MKVILIQSRKSPVVSLQAWVRVGSASESPDVRGISHFIEHLVFKGSRSFNPGEIASSVEAAGGQLNAYTSLDQTVYYITLSSSMVETGVHILSEMVGYPLFDPKEIDSERQVVIEEIKRGQDDSGRQLVGELFASVFKKHPYRIPVIGYDRIVENVSVQKIRNYYSEHYHAQNMFLVIAGDFEFKTMENLVSKAFTGIQKKSRGKNSVIKKRIPEPTQLSPRIKVIQSKFQKRSGYIAWRTIGASHKDTAALEVLALILGQGESSYLNRALVIDNHLCQAIGSSLFSAFEHGIFSISFVLDDNKESWSQFFTKLSETIKNFVGNGVPQEDLEKAITNFSVDNYYSMETVDGLSRNIGQSEFYYKDPTAADVFIEKVKKVTSADIIKVFKKYCQRQTINLVLQSPDSQDELLKLSKKYVKSWNISEIKTSKAKRSSKELSSKKFKMPRATSQLQPELVSLSNGMRVIIHPNQDSYSVSVKMAFPGGSLSEAKDSIGVHDLYGRIWGTRSDTKNETEISEFCDQHALSVYGFSGKNSFGYSAEGLGSYDHPMRDLFIELLRSESLGTPEVFQRELSQYSQSLKMRRDRSEQIVGLNLYSKMFPNHSYGYDSLERESVSSVQDVSQLASVFKDKMNNRNCVVSIAGRFDANSWLKALETIHFSGKDQSTLFQIPAEKLSQPQHAFYKLDRKQTHLMIGFRGIDYLSSERATLSVLQSILAGQGGRLFLELRDKASLAYSVSPFRFDGIQTGAFGVYIACDPEKVVTSERMIAHQLEKLIHEKVGEAEMERAKLYLIGKHDINLQRPSAHTSHSCFDVLYGLNSTDYLGYSQRVKAVNSDQVMNLASELFSRPRVVSLVGPENVSF